jgi:hypothetical protein
LLHASPPAYAAITVGRRVAAEDAPDLVGRRSSWVAGGDVKGGCNYDTWPGLVSGTVIDGDPKVTTDYRQVRDESVTRRLNRPAPKRLPGSCTGWT